MGEINPHDDDHGYLHGDRHYHAAPSGPLADSEAVYDIEGFAVDYMVKTADEECPNCGEKHGEPAVVVRLMFKDDKPMIVSLDPVTASRIAGELIVTANMLLFGPPVLDASQLPPGLLEALGFQVEDEDDSLDMPDDEDIEDSKE